MSSLLKCLRRYSFICFDRLRKEWNHRHHWHTHFSPPITSNRRGYSRSLATFDDSTLRRFRNFLIFPVNVVLGLSDFLESVLLFRAISHCSHLILVTGHFHSIYGRFYKISTFLCLEFSNDTVCIFTQINSLWFRNPTRMYKNHTSISLSYETKIDFVSERNIHWDIIPASHSMT